MVSLHRDCGYNLQLVEAGQYVVEVEVIIICM